MESKQRHTLHLEQRVSRYESFEALGIPIPILVKEVFLLRSLDPDDLALPHGVQNRASVLLWVIRRALLPRIFPLLDGVPLHEGRVRIARRLDKRSKARVYALEQPLIPSSLAASEKSSVLSSCVLARTHVVLRQPDLDVFSRARLVTECLNRHVLDFALQTVGGY